MSVTAIPHIGGGGSGTAGPGLALTTSVYTLLPPTDQPPASANRFFQQAANVSALGNATTVLVFPNTVQLTAQQGQILVLHSWLIYGLNFTATTNLFFSILYQGSPIPGLDRLTVPFGVSAISVLSNDARLGVKGPGMLSMTCTNTTAVAATVAAALEGWTHANTDPAQIAAASVYIPLTPGG